MLDEFYTVFGWKLGFYKSKIMFSKNVGVEASARIYGMANTATFENLATYFSFNMHHASNDKENF